MSREQQREPDDAPTTARTCVMCCQPFTIDAGELAWFLERQMHLPKRCPTCRARRRAEQQAAG